MKETLTFIVNNWVLIAGLLLWLIKELLNWKIINSAKLEALYKEAVAYGEQLKKNGGPDITNEGVKTAVWEYINKRTSSLYTPDEDKIEAVVGQINQAKILSGVPPVVKEISLEVLQTTIDNLRKKGLKKFKFPMDLWTKYDK